MTTFFYLFLGAILGAGVVCFLERKKIKELKVELERTKKEKEEQGKIVSGIDEFNRQMQEIKEGRKQEILKDLSGRSHPSRKASDGQGKIKTNEVADLLDISRATAFRYLEELEKEGKIEQIGAFGRNVEYRIKGR